MTRRSLYTGAAAVLLAACGDAPDRLTAPAPRPLLRSLDATSAAASGAITSGLAPTLCADVSGASRAAGARVITWTCAGTANQQFTLASTGEIQAYAGALCLDASGGAGRDGDAVIVWTCNGQPNQRWTATTDGRLVGINGKCLDIPGASTNRGTGLIIWSCHGGANQRWTMPLASAPPVAPEPPPTAPAPPPTGSVGVMPELPRSVPSTAMPAQTGRTISVPAGGDLQAALDAAQSGDVVSLAPGATYTGGYRLKPKSGSGWIVLRTGVPDAALPAPGTRLTPARAASANLARIVSPGRGLPAIQTEPGAARWRLMGLEVTAQEGTTIYHLVGLGTAGSEQDTEAEIPRQFVLDRVWIHGTPTLSFQRCLTLNSAESAVVDSYLSDCHGRGFDSQAIVGWNGPGPFLIQNNYLDGAGENVMFGGGDPSVPGVVPSDITIRGNYFHKPLGWKGVWTVKNLFELKAGRRVLVEQNVFDGSWADAQDGYAWILKATADSPAAAAVVATEDVTLRANVVRNAGAGVNLYMGVLSARPMQRYRIENNLFERINVPGSPYVGAGRLVQMGSGTDGRDLAIVNNTFGATGSARATGDGINHFMTLYEGALPGMTIARNVAVAGEYGIFGSGVGFGSAALDRYAPGAVVQSNLLVGSINLSTYPAGTLTAANPATVWRDPAAGDWTLRDAAWAGLGADVPTLRTMAARVIGN